MKYFFTILSITVCLLTALPGVSYAQNTTGPNDDVPCDPRSTCLTNPLKGNVTDIKIIIGNVIKGALSVMGSLTLLMLVYGAFLWLTSAGNAERVKQGTDTMLWAVIGTVLVLSSYLILSTYLKYLTGEF